ncbi:MAG TPA: B12-binding domain-containing radical SAM protein [Desulfobacterales bacterium]|nr:B12-binding domain-containing radical SAM protein [Desulfobacterales bacterium]
MKKNKLLFINPCLRRGSYKILPMGLACVMTFVREQGYEFDLLDIDIHEHDDNYVENYIRNNKYDVILYGTIVTHYKWVKWLTKTIKQYHPDTKIIVGNSVAGSCHEVFLKNVPADVVVIGEGEYSCAAVLDAFECNASLSEIAGIAYRDKSGNIIKTSRRRACKIDDLPMVQWDFFELDQYFVKAQGAGSLTFGEREKEHSKISMPVSTARGCINKCTFCHYVFWDDPYRFRSPDNILDEVKRNIDLYGATYINFWDDLSFASLSQVENMTNAILSSGLKFHWSAAIRTDLLGNPERDYERRLKVAHKMKEAGCTAVGFSLESSDPAILKMMEKHVKPEFFVEQIKILKKVGITCNVSIVVGYPIETPESIQATFDLCMNNDIYPSIGYLLPLPYTGMYKYAREHGFISDEDKYLTSITERQDICLNMTKMSDEEVTREIKKCADKANKALQLGLEENSLIKTGGYKRHTNIGKQLNDAEVIVDLKEMSRHENDVSFNYSAATFKMDRGEI